MDLEDALKILLGEDAGVLSVVGSAAHIYKGPVPQTERLPAIAIRTAEESDELTLDGDWTTAVLLRIWSVAIGLGNYSTAKAVDRAVRTCIRTFGSELAEARGAGDPGAGVISNGASPEETFKIQAITRKKARYQNYIDPVQTHEWISDYEIHATEP